jgi:hypothetical protein
LPVAKKRAIPADCHASFRAACQTCATAFGERYERLFDHLVGTQGMTKKR